MKFTVFVNSLRATGSGIEIEAANGSEEGPPFVCWRLSSAEVTKLSEKPYIGKHFYVEITDPMA